MAEPADLFLGAAKTVDSPAGLQSLAKKVSADSWAVVITSSSVSSEDKPHAAGLLLLPPFLLPLPFFVFVFV